MNDQNFRFKGLYYLMGFLYAVSFIVPAYAGGSMSFCCGGIGIWSGWKYAAGAFAVIFSEKLFLGIFWSLPNFIMITLLFIHKRVGQTVL